LLRRYADNQAIPFCSGKVCHEDDIFVTLGTGQQTALSKEVSVRWGNFVKHLDPNAAGLKSWGKYTGEDSILTLGTESAGAKVSRTVSLSPVLAV
jgi:carboxylesterase type B